MEKPKVTKTYGPIHFEDLDPKRFEDLVRELIYDFKDWQTIEATGRGGNDDGFDVRAYEKNNADTEEEQDEDGAKSTHPMEGNSWMIQGKREKEIGPKRVEEILEDIDPKNPPYGYILAASANFSKDSYDTFRSKLREKGVMEFYLWGKAELEDMLHLPKNDRILFTFFGISLVSKRRSRSTEVRSAVTVKNKIFKVFGAGWESLKGASVLVRDLNDTHYPYKNDYKDFDSKPRWEEYSTRAYHPLGIWLRKRKYYAYVDPLKKEWDFTREVDLLYRSQKTKKDTDSDFDKSQNVKGFWDFFPNVNKGYFLIDGLVSFKDIALVDDKGDVLFPFPHIYTAFQGEYGPFSASWNSFEFEQEARAINLSDDWKRIEVFPKKFSKPKFGKIHKKKPVIFDAETLKNYNEYDKNLFALYDVDDRYNYLKQRDIVPVADDTRVDYPGFLQITSIYKVKVKDYLEKNRIYGWLEQRIKQQIGRDLNQDEEIAVYEFQRVYQRDFDKNYLKK